MLAAVALGGVVWALAGPDGPTAAPPAADGSPGSGPSGSGTPDPTDPADPAVAASAELLRWAESELPADQDLTVPDGLRDALRSAGADDDLLQPAGRATGDAVTVVEGTPPEGSTVLAVFGAGDAPGMAVVDPDPGVPTPEELRRREQLAAAVLANPNTGATGRAADVLGAADVDARLLGLLAGLVAQLGVGVADFPPPPGQPADGPPARRVLLDRVDGDALEPGTPATERLLAYLDAQLPPFAPDAVETTPEGVLVSYRYESAPDALVTSDTP